MRTPTNSGWVQSRSGLNDPGCVYFLDGEGEPVDTNNSDNYDEDENILVTPVCIIGQWVRKFHPEFESVPELDMIFRENRSLASCIYDHPFKKDVFEVLQRAQGVQDLEGTTWSDISL